MKVENFKSKRNIYISSLIFLILHYLISCNIYLMGDDFMYATFAKRGVVKSVKEYYFSGNGRWILNVFDSVILKFDRYIYVVIVPLLLLMFVFLLSKIVMQICGVKNEFTYICSMAAVSLIDVAISRETIWWITGGINYLVPAILFLSVVTVSLTIDKDRSYSCKDVVLLCVLCFFASASMEQFGLMTVGWLTFLWGTKFIKNKKIEKYQVLIYIFSILALASIIFAPGNGVRVGEAAQESQTLVFKMIDLFYNNYCSKAVLLFLVMIFLFEAVIILQKNKIGGIIAIINAMLLAGIYFQILPLKLSIMAISFVCFVVITVKTVVDISDIHREWMIYFVLLGIGSQVMLLVSTIWGFRTSLSVLIVYMIFMLILVNIIYEKMKVYNIDKYYSSLYVVIVMTMLLGTIPNIYGYHSNVNVHKENRMQALSGEKVIEIAPYENEIYGWTTPPLSEFHEGYFKAYYDISDKTVVTYKGE